MIESSESELPTTAKRSRAESVRCVVAHDDYASTRQRWRLALRQPAGGTDGVWGTLDPQEGGRVELHLAGPRDEDAEVTFVGGGLALDTLARLDDVLLYPGEPIWLAGVVLVAPSQPLAFERAVGERVTMGLDLGDDFVPPRVSDGAPCGALSLVPGDFEVGPLTELPRVDLYEVVGDEPIPLYADAEGGESKLALALGDGAMVTVGDREGARRRVVVSRRNFVVFGWAPVARLVDPPGAHGTGSTGGWGMAGRGRRGRRINTNRQDYRCRARVALWVLVGDVRERVGTIDPGRELFVNRSEPPRDAMQPIFLDGSPVHLDNGARFAVTTQDLSGCQAQP